MKRVNRLKPLTAIAPGYSLRLVHVIGMRIHHCVASESFKSLLKVAERMNEVFAQESMARSSTRRASEPAVSPYTAS